jgi:hypothetical protein
MSKSITKFFLTLTGIFGLTQVFATEIHPFYLERQDGTLLEGYYSPPSTSKSPIIFAIQGSSCESVLQWHRALSDQANILDLGVITLEKQGISERDINLLTYNLTNCIHSRLEDYVICLENAPLICPEWEGKPIFWGESEGGMLAASLANQIPQTAAVLLFATGGGMKPLEEVKWALHHRLEKHGASQDEIGQYMSFLDEQMEAMILDPTPEKHFLGNTYKWWASFLASEEAIMPLNQQSLPICLVHGVEDYQIPVLSADIAAENLAKTNALTYLRLEGYGHNLDTADVQAAASHWLASILFGQEPSESVFTTQAAQSTSSSLEDWKADLSHYVLSRGKGEIHVEAKGQRDSDGNENASGKVGVSKETDNWGRFEVDGGFDVQKDRQGNVKNEVKVEGRWSHDF